MLAYPGLYTLTCVHVSCCTRVVVSVLISETSDIRPIPPRCFLPRKNKQIDNTAAYHAIENSKALHARRWQTREGIYRIKRQALPDVRDAPLNDDNAAASSTNVKPRWGNWNEDYAMGYQRHP